MTPDIGTRMCWIDCKTGDVQPSSGTVIQVKRGPLLDRLYVYVIFDVDYNVIEEEREPDRWIQWPATWLVTSRELLPTRLELLMTT